MNKLKLLFAAILLLANIGAKAQKAEQNPDYYIEGLYEIQNGRHYLRNVKTHGITINGQNYIPVVEGVFGNVKSSDNRQGELTRFSFDRAKTDCSSGFDKGFYLQYELRVVNDSEWIDEKEYLQGSGNGYSQKDMLVMLVLDYSTSMLRNDYIVQMKRAAVDFINSLAEASPDGNVRVGIIAFSGKSQTKEFPIKQLDRSSKYEMVNFINNVSPGINTAYYYSIKRAVNMLEEYPSKSNLNRNNYNGACVISFTDGLDNESANGEQDLSYINDVLINKTVMGKTIEYFSIGFTGAEDFSRLQNAKFNEVMEKTSTDRDHFKTSSDFSEIERYFRYIASNLTDRWKIINLYTPQGHNGKNVRWVLRCGEPRPQPQPKPEYKPVPNDDTKTLSFQITLGGALPIGDFKIASTSSDQIYEWGLLDKSKYGGAGFGLRLGVQGKYWLKLIEGLGITLSSDFFFNGVNSELKQVFENWEEYCENEGDELDISTPKYLNNDYMVGVNYEYGFGDNFGVYAQFGVGVNMRFITDYREKFNYSTVFSLDYDFKMSFAYTIGIGAVIGNRLVVGVDFFNLGAGKVEGTVYEDEGEGGNQQQFHLSKITPKFLTFNVGVRF